MPSPTRSFIAYTGAYTVAGFNGTGPSGPYTVNATSGCILLLVTRDGKPISPGGSFNASGKGLPYFNTYLAPTSVPVASGNITTFSITGLGPTSGDGVFVLDNDAGGTVTIQASEPVSLDRARRIVEGMQRRPALGPAGIR